jgi:hypothetical protein
MVVSLLAIDKKLASGDIMGGGNMNRYMSYIFSRSEEKKLNNEMCSSKLAYNFA